MIWMKWNSAYHFEYSCLFNSDGIGYIYRRVIDLNNMVDRCMQVFFFSSCCWTVRTSCCWFDVSIWSITSSGRKRWFVSFAINIYIAATLASWQSNIYENEKKKQLASETRERWCMLGILFSCMHACMHIYDDICFFCGWWQRSQGPGKRRRPPAPGPRPASASP